MTMNLIETAAEFVPLNEQPTCKNHPHKPAEWMGELCQECWDKAWEKLWEAGL
jgi:hypothetical protein